MHTTHMHSDTLMLRNHGRMLVEPDELSDTGVPSLKSSLRKKKETKMKRLISLPHPQFQRARQVIGTETHWSVSSMEGSVPAPVPHNEFLLKPHLRGSFRKAGQAWIWNSKWSVFFSILAASPLSLSLKNMNRKILSLLFLLYNKRDLQYGRPPSQHCCHC